jgi:hypothetical protein
MHFVQQRTAMCLIFFTTDAHCSILFASYLYFLMFSSPNSFPLIATSTWVHLVQTLENIQYNYSMNIQTQSKVFPKSCSFQELLISYNNWHLSIIPSIPQVEFDGASKSFRHWGPNSNSFSHLSTNRQTRFETPSFILINGAKRSHNVLLQPIKSHFDAARPVVCIRGAQFRGVSALMLICSTLKAFPDKNRQWFTF